MTCTMHHDLLALPANSCFSDLYIECSFDVLATDIGEAHAVVSSHKNIVSALWVFRP